MTAPSDETEPRPGAGDEAAPCRDADETVGDAPGAIRAEAPGLSADLKARILAAPQTLLDDPEIMGALLTPAAPEDRRIVDLRGAQVAQLQRRLERLREAHRDVVDSAWDHLDGMGRAQSAVLALLESDGMVELGAWARDDLPGLLDVEAARLCLSGDSAAREAASRAWAARNAEGEQAAWRRLEGSGSGRPAAPAEREPRADLEEARRLAEARVRRGRRWLPRLARPAKARSAKARPDWAERLAATRPSLGDAALLLDPATLAAYAPRPPERAGPLFPAGARAAPPGRLDGGALEEGPCASILLRPVEPIDAAVFGAEADRLAAVAIVALDLGPARGPAALALGAADAHRFEAGYTVEMLSFIAGALERLIEARPPAR